MEDAFQKIMVTPCMNEYAIANLYNIALQGQTKTQVMDRCKPRLKAHFCGHADGMPVKWQWSFADPSCKSPV
jgi:hypothetical protein